VVGAARLECDEPAAETGELIRRQLGDSFGDFFDFHVAQYSTAGASLSDGKGLVAPAAATLELRFRREAQADPSRLSGNAILRGRDKCPLLRIRTEPLRTVVSVSGKRELPARDKRAERRLRFEWPWRRRRAHTEARQFGAIHNEPGNLCLRWTAWWGWEDSNFQPNDYQPPALSIEQSGAVS
jgi:hypothetical protein